MPPEKLPGSRILFVPGLLYEGVIRLRNSLYTRGVLRQSRLPRPVLSVGNLTLGGSGKTPFVIYLAGLLARSDRVPVLLSRGYGRSAGPRQIVLGPSERIARPASMLGDEPALIRRKVPQIWVGISGNRHRVGLEILRRQKDAVFILDDGFQHRRIHREVDLLVIDTSQGLSGNRVFPRGTLREPLSSIRRAHVIVLNRSGGDASSHPHETFVRSCHPAARVFHCEQEIEGFVAYHEWRVSEAPTPEGCGFGSVFLVAAIGNPARFRAALDKHRIAMKGSRFFRDHEQLSQPQWERCVREARQSGAECLVITEKDAIKVVSPPAFPLYVALQRTRLEKEEEFRNLIEGCL